MDTQLAALRADASRAPSAPVPALHDQLQLAGLLASDRAADLRFGAKADTLHDERHPAGVAYPCCLAARLNSLVRSGHRRFFAADLRAAYLEEFGRDPDHPAQGLCFRGADLRGADLQDARFERCDLTGADFRGATTDGHLTLIDCPADGSDLRGAQLEEVAP